MGYASQNVLVGRYTASARYDHLAALLASRTNW
jgi:hypothetical protein